MFRPAVVLREAFKLISRNPEKGPNKTKKLDTAMSEIFDGRQVGQLRARSVAPITGTLISGLYIPQRM